MPNKKFLEEYPLYRKCIISSRNTSMLSLIHSFPTPAINLNCDRCKSIQTYNVNPDTKYIQPKGFKTNDIFRLQYVCTGCHSDIREFLLRFTEKSELKEDKQTREYSLQVEKVGQYPSWSIEMDKELEKMLGEHAENYRRGLICESVSYGIGAYAYFRRITEDVIDELLESILDIVEEGEKELYKGQLEKVKKEKNAENKIDIVKDLLPKSLQVDGMNPLKEFIWSIEPRDTR